MATRPATSPAELGFDPWSPSFIADPYPVFSAMRDDHPVLFDERTGQWLITRHADVNRLLRDADSAGAISTWGRMRPWVEPSRPPGKSRSPR